MYKLIFTSDADVIERLSKVGAYPFKCGGKEWMCGETLIVDNLQPFVSNKRELTFNPHLSNKVIIEKGLLDSRLTVEPITEEVPIVEHP